MHHYFEAITNTSGDSLVGYFGRVINRSNNNTVTLASDDNGTPIVVVSGVENMAKTDDFGNLDFYVEPGTYDLEIYAPNATSLIMRVPNVAMSSSKGDRGDPGPEGPPGNGLSDSFTQGKTGAVARSGKDKLKDTVSLRDYGAKGDGVTNDAAAFINALAAAEHVIGSPGDVYYISDPVAMPAGRTLEGNGGTISAAPGIIGAIRMPNSRCEVRGWTLKGNSAGSGFVVLNTGQFNDFNDNLCIGDIGHYFFSTGASNVRATGNRVEGLTAATEITAAIACEACKRVLIANNEFDNILQGWGVHVRNQGANLSESATVANNQFKSTQYSDLKTATSGQTVFTFTLGATVLFDITKNEPKVRIQVNGKPVSPVRPDGTVVYTVSKAANTNNYTITFTNGRTAGEQIKLIGYRGAENIQINGGTKYYVVTGNMVDGTADTGIIALGPYGVVANNNVRNCGYTGIAVYGDVNYMMVSDNIVADCSQMDDGFSSPDDYRVPSVFAGGIFAGGENAVYSGNLIINDSGTMRYGFFSNKFATVRVDGSSALTFHDNAFVGAFSDGRYFLPNQTSGMRMNSIDVDGAPVSYPAQIDIDAAWVERAPAGSGVFDPPSTLYWTSGGTGGVRAVRNTAVTHDGGPSIQTVAGEYQEYTATRAGMFRDCIVTLQFWARNVGGNSYVQAVTQLAGIESPIVVAITDPAWKLYTVRFPFTNDLDTVFKIRIGANIGSGNVQNIQVSARRL